MQLSISRAGCCRWRRYCRDATQTRSGVSRTVHEVHYAGTWRPRFVLTRVAVDSCPPHPVSLGPDGEVDDASMATRTGTTASSARASNVGPCTLNRCCPIRVYPDGIGRFGRHDRRPLLQPQGRAIVRRPGDVRWSGIRGEARSAFRRVNLDLIVTKARSNRLKPVNIGVTSSLVMLLSTPCGIHR